MPFHSYFEGAVRLEWAFSISYTEKKPFHIFRGELKIFLFLKKKIKNHCTLKVARDPHGGSKRKINFHQTT